MARINTGRMTHQYAIGEDGDLVVFMIGMTINSWWRPDRYLPVFAAMPKMLRELSQDKDSGLLGYRLVMDPRGPWLVQYWSSLDKLYAYASNPDAEHRPAWAAYNRLSRKAAGVVGVWHETFGVEHAESIYVSTPLQGLAKATGVQAVTHRLNSARQRIGRTENQPEA